MKRLCVAFVCVCVSVRVSLVVNVREARLRVDVKSYSRGFKGLFYFHWNFTGYAVVPVYLEINCFSPDLLRQQTSTCNRIVEKRDRLCLSVYEKSIFYYNIYIFIPEYTTDVYGDDFN